MGLGGEEAAELGGGRLYGMCSCTGEPKCWPPPLDAGPPGPERRHGSYVNGGSMAACELSAWTCVVADIIVQLCVALGDVVVGYVRRLLRRPVPGFTT